MKLIAENNVNLPPDKKIFFIGQKNCRPFFILKLDGLEILMQRVISLNSKSKRVGFLSSSVNQIFFLRFLEIFNSLRSLQNLN